MEDIDRDTTIHMGSDGGFSIELSTDRDGNQAIWLPFDVLEKWAKQEKE